MNKSNPLLSVIIPVYNVERYLKEAIESILLDSLSPLEIILINDGSNDQSLVICEYFHNNYSNIKVISQPNQGLSAARNTGIHEAVGEYLMFLDSDDAVISERIPSLLTILENKSPDVLMGRCVKYDGIRTLNACQIDYGEIKGLPPAKAFKKFLDKGAWFAAWLLIVKRAFIEKYNLYFLPGIYHEDELWVTRVLLHAKTIQFLSEPFYKYRINREGSIVSGKNIKREFDKIKVIQELQKEVIEDKNYIIKERSAALVYGCIRNLKTYSASDHYGELKDQIINSVHLLRYGKYYGVYIIEKIIGIEKTAKLLGKFK